MNFPQLPYSKAADNNKRPILDVLRQYVFDGELLEIGFGNGQHAEYMSEELAVPWYPTDVAQNLWIMTERKRMTPLKFLQEPKELQVGSVPMHEQIQKKFDHIYSANTLHIMGAQEVSIFCDEVTNLLRPGGYLFLYGPFKYEGNFTSDSNIDFDLHLKANNPLSGIRDFEMIDMKLRAQKIYFEKRFDLPANNNLLVFKKSLD